MSPLRVSLLTLSPRSRAAGSYYLGYRFYGFRYAG
jgi:hypothetical protein